MSQVHCACPFPAQLNPASLDLASYSYYLPTMSSSVEKVSVAIGRDVLEWARERANQEGLSLSAVLTEAARMGREAAERRSRQEAAWRAFMDWATEGVGLPASALEAAERELGNL